METMPAASQTPVVVTMVIATIVLLVAGIFGFNTLQNNVDAKAKDAELKIQEATNGVEQKIQEATNKVDEATNNVNQAANDLKASLSKPQVVDIPELDSLCENLDGCKDWRLSNSYRLQAVNKVIDELTEEDNRDLFRLLDDIYDIDEKEDIDSVTLHAIGRVRSNEELDSDFDLSDTMQIYVEIVLEVDYYEDGNNDETKKKYVRIEAELTDLEDGIDDSDVEILDIESWRENRALDSN